MCGLFASFDPSGSLPQFDRTTAVLAAMAQRGPDGHGVVHLPHCTLAHTRLAIVDRMHGDQPMRHVQTGLTIAYNGEVYNGVDLRARLEARGHVFRTRTDTEIVLAAFAEYGPSCVSMLEGMFAFAIWDPRALCLHVARDRLGEKPLFHAEMPDGRILVTSEIKTLHAAGLAVTLDPVALDYFLAWKHVPADRSIYSEVQVVPPGHILSFSRDRLSAQRYWELPRTATARPRPGEALDRVGELLAASVGARVSGDRDIGIFLSGGIDSTLVAMLAVGTSDRKLFSYTASYGGRLDEAPQATRTAAAFGLSHDIVDMSDPKPEDLEQVCAYLDQPHGDSANLAQALLSRRASQDVAVILSGDGADELFWGYRWYAPPRSMARRLEQMTILGAEARRALLPDAGIERASRFSPERDGASAINDLDFEHYLGGQLLPKADALGMMHGVEVRAPFLDHHLVEYGRALPDALKSGPPAKGLLRDLVARSHPALLPEGPKQGFGAPIEEWLRRPGFRAYVRERLSASARIREVFEPQALDRQLSASFEQSTRMDAYRLWLFLCLEFWLSSRPVAARSQPSSGA